MKGANAVQGRFARRQVTAGQGAHAAQEKRHRPRWRRPGGQVEANAPTCKAGLRVRLASEAPPEKER